MIKFNKFWNMNVIPTEKKSGKEKLKLSLFLRNLKRKVVRNDRCVNNPTNIISNWYMCICEMYD